MKAFDIPGWFSNKECRELYRLTTETLGPILEVGHFLGRSTACICEAIRDSGCARVFRSYDLNIQSEDDWRAFVERSATPGYHLPIPSMVQETFAVGPTRLARENLARAGLVDFVQLILGDFTLIDEGSYSVIFCDAMHSPTEIEINLPHVIRRSLPGCLFAFHDMLPDHVQTVEWLSELHLSHKVDNLGIFREVFSF